MLGQILVELNATKCIKCFLTIHNRLCESKNIWRLQKRRFDKNDASFKFEEVKGDISQSLSCVPSAKSNDRFRVKNRKMGGKTKQHPSQKTEVG